MSRQNGVNSVFSCSVSLRVFFESVLERVLERVLESVP